MSFEMFDEYSDKSQNQFVLERSEMVGSPPQQTKDTAQEHVPKLEIVDPAKQQKEYSGWLEAYLRNEMANDKKAEKAPDKAPDKAPEKPPVLPKLKDNYKTADVDKAVTDALANKVPLVVHIGAEWCGPCKKMEREVWPGVEKDNKGKAAFLHLDGDTVVSEKKGGANAQKMAEGVENYPTIRVFMPERGKDGQITFKKLAEHVGGMNDDMVRDMLKVIQPKK